jgi:methionine-rich copper-binding protein CopC
MRLALSVFAIVMLAVRAASAHAFLDRASPAVGSSTANSPAIIALWFSEELERAFSTVEVTDQTGKRMDAGDASVDAGDTTELHATLKLLPPGSYKVAWRVVSIDAHRTEGTFTFTVSP